MFTMNSAQNRLAEKQGGFCISFNNRVIARSEATWQSPGSIFHSFEYRGECYQEIATSAERPPRNDM